MKVRKRLSFIVTLIAVYFISVLSTQAALTTIGQAQYGGQNYSLIWDNESPFGSIVWLDYTKSYANWQTQSNWASGLNSGGVLTYNIDPAYTVTWSGDWQLPSTVNDLNSSGYNITSSEMGHLYYMELGNKGGYDTAGNPTGCYSSSTNWNCLSNIGPFQNLLPDIYWSTQKNSGSAWAFDNTDGSQFYAGNTNYEYAIAVRPAYVAVAPEPISFILFVTGGTFLAGRKYIKSAKERKCRGTEVKNRA